jgi:hypothetical protein
MTRLLTPTSILLTVVLLVVPFPALAVDRTFQIEVENSLKGSVPSNWWLHASWRDQTLVVFVSPPTRESFNLGTIRPGKKGPWKTSARRTPSPSGTKSSPTRTSPLSRWSAAMAAKAAFSSPAENTWPTPPTNGDLNAVECHSRRSQSFTPRSRKSFSVAASSVHVARAWAAWRTSSNGGNVGAMRKFVSFGSRP